MDYDLLLRQFGFKGRYEDLTRDERETFHNMLGNFHTNQLTIEKIRDYIKAMKAAVEEELTKHDLSSRQDLFLKARLRNYVLLEAFLDTPEKARKALENALKQVNA